MLYDDDSEEPNTSSREYLESTDKARREMLKKQLQKEGLKQQADVSGKDLKNLKLSLLKGQVKDKKAEDPKKPGSIGTKTREQEIAAQKLTADTKPTTEQLAKQGGQTEKAEDVLRKEEIQSEDA